MLRTAMLLQCDCSHPLVCATAMKVYASDGLQGQVKPEKLLYYSLSLPIAPAAHRRQRPHGPCFPTHPAEEMRNMEETLSSRNKLALDLYFQNHSDHHYIAV